MSEPIDKQALLDVIDDETCLLQGMVANGNFEVTRARKSIERLTLAAELYSLELRLAAVAQ